MPHVRLEHTTKTIVARHFRKPPDALEPTTRLREDLGGDSLDMIELAFDLERALGVSIPDGDAAELRTVGDAVRYLEARLA